MVLAAVRIFCFGDFENRKKKRIFKRIINNDDSISTKTHYNLYHQVQYVFMIGGSLACHPILRRIPLSLSPKNVFTLLLRLRTAASGNRYYYCCLFFFLLFRFFVFERRFSSLFMLILYEATVPSPIHCSILSNPLLSGGGPDRELH